MKNQLFNRALFLFCFFLSIHSPLRAEELPKAREVIEAAIEAMGGERYLQVKSAHSQGLYYGFDKEERTRIFAPFLDWTAYGPPIKWRFQLGDSEKKRKVEIYNLEIKQGWVLEGQNHVEEVAEEKVQQFERWVRQDIDVLLRRRVNEEGMHLFYYSREEVAGSGEYEAVEFVDATNDSVVVFFDHKTHLPVKWEAEQTNQLGIRQKYEQEFYNWHTIQGVHTPMRYAVFLEGKKISQRELNEISYNVEIPPEHFLEPRPEE